MLRRPAMAAAFFLLMGAELRLAQAQEEGDEGPAAAQAEAAAAAPATRPATTPRRRARRAGTASGARRGIRADFPGRVVPEEQLRTEPLPRPSGNLHIVSLANPNDRAKVNIYNRDGSYSVDAIEELNFVLRCRRTDAEKPIDSSS